jgi:CDP-glycerol glycerophosphotransferase
MLFLFSKRNKNIWLFGSWNGETYNDNSKYLFEYVVENFPSIEAVWITKNSQIKKKLLFENKQCYLSNEFIARKLRMSAGIVFFTNGISDIGNYDLSHGCKKIALWHGMPLKKLHYATNSIKNRKYIFRCLQYFFLKLYHGTDRNITIATSERTKDLLIESFEVQPESVVITGQPRNDVLFDQNLSNKLKIKLHHKPDERFILYIPT